MILKTLQVRNRSETRYGEVCLGNPEAGPKDMHVGMFDLLWSFCSNFPSLPSDLLATYLNLEKFRDLQDDKAIRHCLALRALLRLLSKGLPCTMHSFSGLIAWVELAQLEPT